MNISLPTSLVIHYFKNLVMSTNENSTIGAFGGPLELPLGLLLFLLNLINLVHLFLVIMVFIMYVVIVVISRSH
jgi:hypothetical protein